MLITKLLWASDRTGDTKFGEKLSVVFLPRFARHPRPHSQEQDRVMKMGVLHVLNSATFLVQSAHIKLASPQAARLSIFYYYWKISNVAPP